MLSRYTLIRLALAGILAAGLTGCREGEQTEAGLDHEDQISAQPDVEPPKVKFPVACQQEDISVNAFISRVLDICQRGDYDKFCNLFGISEVPPSHDDFKRIWAGVGEVAVRSVHLVPQDPPQYFVHAIVSLRKPDAERRTQRDIVIRVFRELDDWRISGAPKEIIRKVLIADTQPAPAAPDPGEPARGNAAPTTGPAVYKDKSSDA